MDDHRVQGNARQLRKPTLKKKVEKERDELREALDILEAHLGAGTQQYHAVFRLPRGTRGIYHVGFGDYHTPTERSHLYHGL